MSKLLKVVNLFVLLSVSVSLTGCFSSHPKDIEVFLKPDKVDVTSRQYLLQPPDEVEILCPEVPEIHQQRQVIRPDGKISFQGLGEMYVAGKTPSEVTKIIEQKISQTLQQKLHGEKPIDVRISMFRSKSYYVLGQVLSPGPQLYTGRNTVLSAIAQARLNPMAWKARVQVIRPSADKNSKPRIFEFNYSRMVVHGDAAKNVLLQEGDIVYIPPTIPAAIAMKLEEILRPIARAFTGIYMTQGPAGMTGVGTMR